jgi:hypothetical protein
LAVVLAGPGNVQRHRRSARWLDLLCRGRSLRARDLRARTAATQASTPASLSPVAVPAAVSDAALRVVDDTTVEAVLARV